MILELRLSGHLIVHVRGVLRFVRSHTMVSRMFQQFYRQTKIQSLHSLRKMYIHMVLKFTDAIVLVNFINGFWKSMKIKENSKNYILSYIFNIFKVRIIILLESNLRLKNYLRVL